MKNWKLNLGLFLQADPNKSTDAGMSVEMKTYYVMELLKSAEPNLVYDNFAKKKPIPAGNGKTIEFRKWSTLPKALSPLTEGVTPDGSNSSASAITASIQQYGDYVRETDVLDETAIDDVIVQDTQMLGAQAGKTIDTITREIVCGGYNVSYATKNNGSDVFAPVLSRTDITSLCLLKRSDIVSAVAKLKALDAPKLDGGYVAIIHPYVSADIQLSTELGGWIDVNKYTNAGGIYNGEIGKLGGVRFVESTEAKIIAPAKIVANYSRLTVANVITGEKTFKVAEAISVDEGTAFATPMLVYVNGVEVTINSITGHATAGEATVTVADNITTVVGQVVCGKGAGKDGSAVFMNMIIGAEAYATTGLEGLGLQHFVKPLGSGEDPLNQRSSVGWKVTKATLILNDAYMVRVESGSTFSATAKSN